MSQVIVIPEYLQKNLMFTRSVRCGRGPKESFDVVLTRGPRFYATKNHEVLSFCDLTGTCVKDIECLQSDFNDRQQQDCAFDFDICFSYDGNAKHTFFLLKMRDKFLIMTKRSDQIAVLGQYENVRCFKVEESYAVVQIRIEMLDGQSLYEDLYRLVTDDPIDEKERFGGVADSICSRIAKVNAELATTKLDVLKQFDVVSKELRFGPQSIHEVRIFIKFDWAT